MANTAKGAGYTENMNHYKETYLRIDHESLGQVVEALRGTEIVQVATMTVVGEQLLPAAPALDGQAPCRSG